MDTIAHAASSLSLRSYLQVLRRHRAFIIGIAVFTGILAALPSLTAAPVYLGEVKVQAKTMEREGVFEDDASGDPVTPFERYQDLSSEVEILQSAPTKAEVIDQFDDPPDFTGPVVVPVSVSDLLTISVYASDPKIAADVANAYADVFVRDRRARTVADLETKADELRARSAEARAELEVIAGQLGGPGLGAGELANLQLRQQSLLAQVAEFEGRADRYEVDAALRGRGTQVIERAALDTAPVGSSPFGPALIGIVIGLLLGVGLAVVIDTLQDRVSTPDDLAAVRRSLPILAAIPHADVDAPSSDFIVKEAYRYLRTGLRVYGLNAELRSVIVTSAVGGEGKTTIAVNLARAMAEAGDRVLLVDCDLRRPSVHQVLGLPNGRGVTSVVVDNVGVADAVHFVDGGLAVLTSGPPVQNPTEMLGSERFSSVIAALSSQADFVVLDSPPVLPVADALIAGLRVDGAVVVSRIGVVRRRAVREMLSRMDEARVPLVGFVANDVSSASSYDSYEPDAKGASRRRQRRKIPVPVEL